MEVFAETFAAKLNRSTLNGTWNALTLEIDDGENTVLFSGTGTDFFDRLLNLYSQG